MDLDTMHRQVRAYVDGQITTRDFRSWLNGSAMEILDAGGDVRLVADYAWNLLAELDYEGRNEDEDEVRTQLRRLLPTRVVLTAGQPAARTAASVVRFNTLEQFRPPVQVWSQDVPTQVLRPSFATA